MTLSNRADPPRLHSRLGKSFLRFRSEYIRSKRGLAGPSSSDVTQPCGRVIFAVVADVPVRMRTFPSFGKVFRQNRNARGRCGVRSRPCADSA